MDVSKMMRSNPLVFLGAQTIERPLKPSSSPTFLEHKHYPRRQLWNLIVADYMGLESMVDFLVFSFLRLGSVCEYVFLGERKKK